MASGAVRITARNSCDLAVDGSPSIRMLMSPRRGHGAQRAGARAARQRRRVRPTRCPAARACRRTVGEVALRASEKHHEQRALLLRVAKDGGREGLGKQRKSVAAARDLLDVLDVVLGELGRAQVLGEQSDLSRREQGVRGGEGAGKVWPTIAGGGGAASSLAHAPSSRFPSPMATLRCGTAGDRRRSAP
eukprot:scaffold5496_cov112-Isochrysis_galbana.AAC.4